MAILSDLPFAYFWYWKARLPERKGQRCRVLTRGRMNSVLVEFEDGYKVITSRYALRKVSYVYTVGPPA